MAFNPEPALRVLKAHLEGMDRFVKVQIGPPPTSVGPAGFHAILTVGEGGPTGESVLDAPIELHALRILIYRAQAAAASEADALARFLIPPEVEALIRADYTLGGTVRNVSYGEYGASISWEFGDEEIASKSYWTAHIDVPVIVDTPSVVFAA